MSKQGNLNPVLIKTSLLNNNERQLDPNQFSLFLILLTQEYLFWTLCVLSADAFDGFWNNAVKYIIKRAYDNSPLLKKYNPWDQFKFFFKECFRSLMNIIMALW